MAQWRVNVIFKNSWWETQEKSSTNRVDLQTENRYFRLLREADKIKRATKQSAVYKPTMDPTENVHLDVLCLSFSPSLSLLLLPSWRTVFEMTASVLDGWTKPVAHCALLISWYSWVSVNPNRDNPKSRMSWSPVESTLRAKLSNQGLTFVSKNTFLCRPSLTR